MAHWTNSIVLVLEADTTDLNELAKIGGATSSRFFNGVNFRAVDLTNQNLENWDLDGANLSYCELTDEQEKQISIRRASYYNNLATSLNAQGRHEEAEQLFRKGGLGRRKATHVSAKQNSSAVGDNISSPIIVNQRDPQDKAIIDSLLARNQSLIAENSELREGIESAIVGSSNLDDSTQEIEEARKASELDPSNPDAWYQLGHLYERVGELTKSIDAYETILTLPEGSSNEWQAIAYGNLGNVYWTRGDLDRAVEDLERSLAIYEWLGLKKGMAIQYSNLGNIYHAQGDLDRAVEMYEKLLAIYEALGEREGMASAYGNLGLVCNALGELDRAVDMLERSLTIYEALGLKEDMASVYGNLGVVYHSRSELDSIHLTRSESDRAVEMYGKSLAIYEALDEQQGMANGYGNLGVVYRARGELDHAIEMYEKSLAIYEALGDKVGMATQYSNLGNFYHAQGDLDRAVEMYEKLLVIYEALGYQEDLASAYGNLGNVYQTHGELDRARKFWELAAELFATLGSPNEVRVRSSIAELDNPGN